MRSRSASNCEPELDPGHARAEKRVAVVGAQHVATPAAVEERKDRRPHHLRITTHTARFAGRPARSARVRGAGLRKGWFVMSIAGAASALADLERMVRAVKGEQSESKFAKALATLEDLARKEGIAIAIVGGLAAIHYGYERFTKDIDIVVQSAHLDILARVAPQYGIKVIWKDPEGWHKLQCEGVPIDVVPEGRKPRKDAPATIPGPRQLGVREGAGYAAIGGWVETKLGSYRVQDQADVVQVLKGATAATVRKIRKHLGATHAVYVRRFEGLLEAAEEEREQERERGGGLEEP